LPDDALTPKQSMMAGWVYAARMTYKGDPSDEQIPEEGKGWSKVIPRALGFFTVLDMTSALVVFLTRNYICDVPLRTWLLGGIMLGGPTDLVVKGLAWAMKPRYKYYKLTVVNARDVDNTAFELDKLLMYDEFGHPIDGWGVDPKKEGNHHIVTLEYPRMISSYRLITSQSGVPGTDVVTWELYASNNGTTWKLLDEQDHHDDDFMPLARETGTELITEMSGLVDVGFRQAFLGELIATSAALAWLTVGSAWIAGGSETCVDSAPELWYYCFLMAVATWSCMGTVTIGLIVSAVAMILLGVKTPG